MDFYFLFIILSSLIGIRFFIKDFNKDYLSKDDTACIKGFFILIVFFSHFMAYDNLSLPYNHYLLEFRNFLSQLMVSLFLFYSGYGVYESIKTKKSYVEKIPKNRILKTLLHFDIAILAFILVNLFIGKSYGIKITLLSFTGWESIGNSNWYIFTILCLYLITYISFTIFEKKDKNAIICSCLLSLFFMMFLQHYKDLQWHNTMFCYLLGMIYSYNKENINNSIMKDNKKYILSMLVFIFIFDVIRVNDPWNYYNLYAMAFCMIVVGITMKVHFTSKILKWFGDNLFWIYILQRIPMIILYENNYLSTHPMKAFVISFVVTIILTIIFKFIADKIDSLIFKNNKKRITS